MEKIMSTAHEEDVVVAFRQAVQEELLRMQKEGNGRHEPLQREGEPVEATLRRLCARHAELEHEVALLRTIVLRMLSEPVDNE
jgi:hypothetical protein